MKRIRALMPISVSVWIYALLLAVLTSLPYALHGLNTPQGWQYSGAAVVPDGVRLDYQVYVASMWQGARGDWAYTMPFTHEAHTGIPLVHTTYMALGAVANLLPLDFIAMYHVARCLLTVGVVLALWLLVTRFFADRVGRWLALLFATLTSGWSWLLLFIAPDLTTTVSPIEFWLQDAFNLFGTFYTPHFALILILQVAIVLSFDAWLRDGRWPSLTVLTLALGYAAGVQPYAAPFWFGLLGALALYHGVRKMKFRRVLWLAVPLGVHGLLTVYVYLTMNADPVWADFLQQTATVSPPISHYITGYLPYLLPLLIAIPALWRQRDAKWLLPALWVLIAVLLLYAPLPSQRRYLLGLQTPLALFSAYGWLQLVNLRPIFERDPQQAQSRHEIIANTLKLSVTALYIAIAAAGNLGIWGANLLAALDAERNDDVYFSPDTADAYAWLREHSTPDDLIVSVFDLDGLYSGGWLGMAIGRRVYMGHWAFTAFSHEKGAQLRRFYDPATSDTWRQEFLQDIGADYIWYDVDARALGAWQPDLPQVYANETLVIYGVVP